MLVRFCLYSLLKNLRFADPFLVLFLLHEELSLAQVGLLLGAQHGITALLEVPLGLASDRFGRRRALAVGFATYAVSFALYGLGGSLAVFWAAAACFGVAEALRSGSHKAIMLDWLEQRGERHRATELLSLTRTWSKSTSGLSALAGGVLLFAFASYAPLFWLSCAASLAAAVLMLSYPRALEGEQVREGGSTRRRPLRALTELAQSPEVAPLVAQSTLFESQIKVMLRYYLQPLLKQVLAGLGMPVLSTGAIAIGAIEALRDGLGAAGARLGASFERRAGGATRALRVAYLCALASAVLLAACVGLGAFVPAVAIAIGLGLLQNARRPVFVAAFDQHVPGPQRATSLSVEQLLRGIAAAIMLPGAGWLADQLGLWAAFAACAAVLALGLAATPAAQARSGIVGT